MSTNPMFSEENRLNSFREKGWPLSFLKPEALAKCGFFYFGDSDRVKCPFCSVVVFNWQVGDNPFLEHRDHSKKCPFINGRDVGNIFLDTDPRDIYPIGNGQDLCGFLNFTKRAKIVDDDPEEPGIQFQHPTSIEFVTYNSRLASFVDWPVSELVSPAKLAESGFYYNGPVIDYLGIEYPDFVVCFHCGISLCQWLKDDDPWVEHTKFNPDCIYIQLVARQNTIWSSPELQTESTSSQPSDPSTESTESTESTPMESTSTESTPTVTVSELEKETTASPQSSDTSTELTPMESIVSIPEPQTESTVEVVVTLEPETESTSTHQSPDVSKESKVSISEQQMESEDTETVSELEKEATTSPQSSDRLIESSSTHPSDTLTESKVSVTEIVKESTETVTVPELEKESTISPQPSDVSAESTEPSVSTEPTESTLKVQPFTPFCWIPKPKTEKFCCKVCLDSQVGAIFSPCLHTSCVVCASSISSCPICRANIKRIIRLNDDLSKSKISFYL